MSGPFTGRWKGKTNLSCMINIPLLKLGPKKEKGWQNVIKIE